MARSIRILGQFSEIHEMRLGPGLVADENSSGLLMLRNGGRAQKSIAGGAADYTLTEDEYGVNFIELTGAITGNVGVIVPHLLGSMWVIKNSATGAFSVTIKGPSGSGIVVAATKVAIVMSDGTNIVRVTADA